MFPHLKKRTGWDAICSCNCRFKIFFKKKEKPFSVKKLSKKVCHAYQSRINSNILLFSIKLKLKNIQTALVEHGQNQNEFLKQTVQGQTTKFRISYLASENR